MKPFPFDRFLKAVNKFQDQVKTLSIPSVDFILLQSDKKMHKINFSIAYIEGNMVIINKVRIPIGQTYRLDFMTILQKRQ